MLLSPAQSEVILEYFQDDVPVLFFLLGEDGVVLAVNRYCQELLGTFIIGRSFGELLVDFQQLFSAWKKTKIRPQIKAMPS